MKPIKLFATIALLLLMSSFAWAAPPQLHVDGNKIKDTDGNIVRLQGVNVPSMEWRADGDHVLQSVDEAIDNWHANFIRLPLCQDRWFGKAPEQTDDGTAYRNLVQQVVDEVSKKNCYILLDLHWNDANQWGKNIGQHELPDDNSLAFWKAVAAQYANDPAVLFDLYNEPHDVSWDLWQHGGQVTEHFRANQAFGASPAIDLVYHSPGMQGLLDAVRVTGAKNVVVVGGLDWAYQLDGIVQGHGLNDDNGNGIIYATHIYPQKKDWDVHVTPASKRHAIIVSEMGAGTFNPWNNVNPYYWVPSLFSYVDQHQFSWSGWSFHPSAGPTIISNWDYTPTPYWGSFVRAELAKRDPNAPLPRPSFAGRPGGPGPAQPPAAPAATPKPPATPPASAPPAQ
jgi:hypothetical protein